MQNGSAPHEGQKLPISHGVLERHPDFNSHFEVWKQTGCHTKILNYISKNYNVWLQTSCEQCDAIDFLKLPSFRGFVIHFMDMDHNCSEVTYLSDYLKDKVLELDYKIQFADKRVFEKPRWLEKIERYYLKPVVSIKENEKIEQRFGNITIELKFRDEEPLHLKFSAATYHDCQFKNADEFKHLMAHITKG